MDSTPSNMPGPSTERVERAWKSTLLSVTGVAKGGRGKRKLTLQHQWQLVQHNDHVHRWWVTFTGVKECTGILQPSFSHSC